MFVQCFHFPPQDPQKEHSQSPTSLCVTACDSEGPHSAQVLQPWRDCGGPPEPWVLLRDGVLDSVEDPPHQQFWLAGQHACTHGEGLAVNCTAHAACLELEGSRNLVEFQYMLCLFSFSVSSSKLKKRFQKMAFRYHSMWQGATSESVRRIFSLCGSISVPRAPKLCNLCACGNPCRVPFLKNKLIS